MVLLLEEQILTIEPASLRSLGLTGRQSEVLAHLANGRTKADIARSLGMRPRTVDTHLQFIYERLDVSGRGAAVAKAFQVSRMNDGQSSGEKAELDQPVPDDRLEPNANTRHVLSRQK